MTHREAESEAAALIALGREAMAPSAAARARVRSSLKTALITSAPSTFPGLSGTKLGQIKVWATRALATALVAGIGGAGYWLGYRAGRAAGHAPSLVVTTSHSQLEVAPGASASTPASAVNRVVPLPTPTTPSPARSIGGARRVEASAPPAPSNVPIDEELRTLRRAEHALRQGNPRLALVLLEDLDRNTQGGRLLEERAAELAVARCSLEPGEAKRLRLEFERAHTGSVYLSRVEQSCQGE